MAVVASLWLATPIGCATAAGAGRPGETADQDGDLDLDIPAQPLADALEKYSAATGLALFYDAALAAGRRSAPTRGMLAPMLGLEMLLRGTGYVPRRTGPATVSIVPIRPSVASDAMLRQYAPFFALLQSRIERALCGGDLAGTGTDPIVFRLWLPSSGVIARAEVVSPGGERMPNLDAAKLLGTKAGVPPAGLPQPITMAVFPALPGEAPRCAGER